MGKNLGIKSYKSPDVQKQTDADLKNTILNGKGKMPSYKSLTPEQVGALPTGSPLVGERVFSERGCAACHGNMAEGTRNGPALKASNEAYTTISLTADLWRHGPRMIDRAEELGIPWPTLKATDVGDLVSFLNAPSSPK